MNSSNNKMSTENLSKEQLNKLRNRYALARYSFFQPGDVLSFEFTAEVYFEIPIDRRSKKKVKLQLKTQFGSRMKNCCAKYANPFDPRPEECEMRMVDGFLIPVCAEWKPLVDIAATNQEQEKDNDKEYTTNFAYTIELASLESSLNPILPIGDGQLNDKLKELRNLYGDKACMEADPHFGLFGTPDISLTFHRAELLNSTSFSEKDTKLGVKGALLPLELTDTEADAQSIARPWTNPDKKDYKDIGSESTVRDLYGEYYIYGPYAEPGVVTDKCKFLTCHMLPLKLSIQLRPKNKKRGGRLQFAFRT